MLMAFRRLDLPAPLEPIRQTVSPELILISIFLIAFMDPYDTFKFLIFNI